MAIHVDNHVNTLHNNRKERVFKENLQSDQPVFQFENSEQNTVGNNTNKEIAAKNEKENDKSLWKNLLVLGGAVVSGAVAICALYKNIKLSKELAKTTQELASTNAKLNNTQSALSEANCVINQIKEIVSKPAKTSFKESVTKFLKSATSGLKMTNELGSECGKLCDSVKHIKDTIS